MRAFSLCMLLVSGCGGSRGGDGDTDVDIDTDVDTDTDTDTGSDDRPPCPDDDQIPFDRVCDTQDDCQPTECHIAGNVCVEERWVCGSCDWCFYENAPFLNPPSGWECDDADEFCVPR